MKRLLGRSFDDVVVQRAVDEWPFSIVNVASKPRVDVEYRYIRQKFSPEEIAAWVLENLKESAETYLDEVCEFSSNIQHVTCSLYRTLFVE